MRAAVLIGKLPHPHLIRALRGVGFKQVIELDFGVTQDVLGFQCTVFGPFDGTSGGEVDEVNYPMDTSLLVRDKDGSTVLNINDNPIKPKDARAIAEQYGSVDCAILPCSGASLYPHAFLDYSPQDKQRRAAQLTERMVASFLEISRILAARWVVPAAGSYVMGGAIADYSAYLHQPTPGYLRTAWDHARMPSRLGVMCTGDVLDPDQGITSNPHALMRDFTEQDRTDYAVTLSRHALAQEGVHIPAHFRIPWPRLLLRARENQWRYQERAGITCAADVVLSIRRNPGIAQAVPMQRLRFPLDRAGVYADSDELGRPGRQRMEFVIDEALLLMSLLGAANWNNVEIGALVQLRREPDEYVPTIHSLMSFFTL